MPQATFVYAIGCGKQQVQLHSIFFICTQELNEILVKLRFAFVTYAHKHTN